MKPMGLLLQANATEKTTQSGAKGGWRNNCHKLKKDKLKKDRGSTKGDCCSKDKVAQ
jgi:hypothetical protein